MAGLLFKGNTYLDVMTDAGVSTGYNGPINGTSLAIQVQDPDEKMRTSMNEATYGQALDTVLIPKPQKITLSFDEQPADLAALGLGGTVETFSQAAVTAQAVTVVARLGKWVELGYRNTTAVIDAASTPVILPDVDFIVDHARGLIKFLPDSTNAVTEGASVALKVTASAVTANRISGATKPTFLVAILLDGINQADGKRGRLKIPRCMVAPSGDVNPISGEFIVTTLKGTIITPEGQDASYSWDIETVMS